VEVIYGTVEILRFCLIVKIVIEVGIENGVNIEVSRWRRGWFMLLEM
jgi:hypothetical protein